MDNAPFFTALPDGEDAVLVAFLDVGAEYYAACTKSDGIVCSSANARSLAKRCASKSLYAGILTDRRAVLGIGLGLFTDGDGLVRFGCRTIANGGTLHAGDAGTNAYSRAIGTVKSIPARIYCSILHIHFRASTDGYAVLSPYGSRAGLTALHTAADSQRPRICRPIYSPSRNTCIDLTRSNARRNETAAFAFHLKIHVAYIIERCLIEVYNRLSLIRIGDSQVIQTGDLV